MENKNFIWVFVVLALGVGLALGLGITGNIIKGPQTYEKVDANLFPSGNYATYQGVLNMFKDKCISYESDFIPAGFSCGDYCESQSKTCVATLLSRDGGDGSLYTVELLSASDTDATVKVTDAFGNLDTHSISEGSYSLFSSGIEIGVVSADETNSSLIARLVVGDEIDLSIGGSNPSDSVLVFGGEYYTISLISASDTDATVKVTDASGFSETRTVTEGNFRAIAGLEIFLVVADESINSLQAKIVAGRMLDLSIGGTYPSSVAVFLGGSPEGNPLLGGDCNTVWATNYTLSDTSIDCVCCSP